MDKKELNWNEIDFEVSDWWEDTNFNIDDQQHTDFNIDDNVVINWWLEIKEFQEWDDCIYWRVKWWQWNKMIDIDSLKPNDWSDWVDWIDWTDWLDGNDWQDWINWIDWINWDKGEKWDKWLDGKGWTKGTNGTDWVNWLSAYETYVNAWWEKIWEKRFSEILIKIIDTKITIVWGGGWIKSIKAWTNVTIDNSDPFNPIISSVGWGGGWTWWSITGILSSQTDLQTALNTKEPTITWTTTSDFWSGWKTFINFANTVRSTLLTWLSLVSTTVISATDTVLVALWSLQAQITALTTTVSNKANIASPTFTGTVSGITATMVWAPSGSGTSSGANTGDNATNTQYSWLAASKEDTANKATTMTGNTASNILFLTAKAVNDWWVATFATISALATKANLTGGNTFTGIQSLAFNAPQWFLINGQIVTSVTTGNLTVAIKTLAWADPSVGDPVYCRIGNTVRTLTSALNVTINAWANSFNAWSSELATQEIDYFSYLYRNAAFSYIGLLITRVPYANRIADLSGTATNEKYAAWQFPADGTYPTENIWRFNAILSAGAWFTWSLPATSVIINRPIFETRWLTYAPVRTFDGTAPTWINQRNRYKISMDKCEISTMADYTTAWVWNSVATITIPFAENVIYYTTGIFWYLNVWGGWWFGVSNWSSAQLRWSQIRLSWTSINANTHITAWSYQI